MTFCGFRQARTRCQNDRLHPILKLSTRPCPRFVPPPSVHPGSCTAQTIDIDFEFFSPAPLDYHSLKLLLSQLLSHDAASLDLGSIADLILAQNELGSCVKTDGEEGDPYAVLSVLNLNAHPVRPRLFEKSR